MKYCMPIISQWHREEKQSYFPSHPSLAPVILWALWSGQGGRIWINILCFIKYYKGHFPHGPQGPGFYRKKKNILNTSIYLVSLTFPSQFLRVTFCTERSSSTKVYTNMLQKYFLRHFFLFWIFTTSGIMFILGMRQGVSAQPAPRPSPHWLPLISTRCPPSRF